MYQVSCLKCEGTGFIQCAENQSPLGSGMYWPMISDEPCPDCLENGVCPQCGDQWADEIEGDEDSPCPVCGWYWE